MNKPDESRLKTTIESFKKMKAEYRKISMLTCYDAAFGKILSDTSLDMLLVGDSLGNVMLGHENTLSVTLGQMIEHTKAISRVVKNKLIITDMPFGSYHETKDALRHATLLLKKGGAHAVKLEGCQPILPIVEKLVQFGIPVMGHLGLMPQHIRRTGGYRRQGLDQKAGETILENAKSLEKAGVSALVLELIPADLAERITQTLSIPTIGIGAGAACDGQVLVLHDMLGFYEKTPRFVKQYLKLHSLVSEAVNIYDREVKEGLYPEKKHSF